MKAYNAIIIWIARDYRERWDLFLDSKSDDKGQARTGWEKGGRVMG